VSISTLEIKDLFRDHWRDQGVAVYACLIRRSFEPTAGRIQTTATGRPREPRLHCQEETVRGYPRKAAIPRIEGADSVDSQNDAKKGLQTSIMFLAAECRSRRTLCGV
jgi:hypothetical protein